MRNRVLPFDYTPKEMDQGYGMQFHPASGTATPVERMHYFNRYDVRSKRYEAMYLFGSLESFTDELLARISDGKNYKAGDSYPAHWTHCPFTGECIHEPFQEFASLLGQLSLKDFDLKIPCGARYSSFQKMKMIVDWVNAPSDFRMVIVSAIQTVIARKVAHS